MRIFFFILLTVPALFAQDVNQEQVYKPLQWENEKNIFFSIGAIAGGTILARNLNNLSVLSEPAQVDILDPNSINSFDRPAIDNWSLGIQEASDYFQYGVIAIPLVLGLNKEYRQSMGKHLVYAVETMAITSGVTHIVKNTIRRARPFTYNTDLPYSRRLRNRNNQSFPSGHTSFVACLSFFGAKTLTDLNPDLTKEKKIAIWSVGTIIPAVTGYLRVKGGKHFSTDVIAGGLLGAFTGWLVPNLHLNDSTHNISLSPAPGGIILTYDF